MRYSTIKVVLGAALAFSLPAADAWAHWCDDMWISAYNIVVRPDSDTSPKALYVENHMGYQLPNFKLTATSSSGGAITLTAPATLKIANMLLPGERGIWKIASGNPAKIEDITFSVTFGSSGQSRCYPLVGASPVEVVKNDGTIFPAAPAGLDNPKAPSNCTAIIGCARFLINQAIADFEDVNVGLDKLLQLFCSGRASWGYADATTPTYCRDTSSTTCPTTKPVAIGGSVSDYDHLWAAGELAIRKGSLGARLPVFRERLKCAVNDGDPGFAGYPLFVLGYLGDDASAKTFIQSKASAGGDLGTIAKAALYLMGDTAQKADVQAGVKSSSVYVKAACAAALGIVDKDDAPVTSTLIPEVKWTNPTEDAGKGQYAAHLLEIVAFDRRGWVAKGMANGPITFYGETGASAGGALGTGGRSGAGGAVGGGGTSGPTSTVGTGGAPGNGGRLGNGGAIGSGGRSGSGGAGVAGLPGAGGAEGTGGSLGSGGQAAGGAEPSSGGTSGGSAGGSSSGSSSGQGGAVSASGGTSGSKTDKGGSSGCNCGLAGRPDNPSTLWWLALSGLALLLGRQAMNERARK